MPYINLSNTSYSLRHEQGGLFINFGPFPLQATEKENKTSSYKQGVHFVCTIITDQIQRRSVVAVNCFLGTY